MGSNLSVDLGVDLLGLTFLPWSSALALHASHTGSYVARKLIQLYQTSLSQRHIATPHITKAGLLLKLELSAWQGMFNHSPVFALLRDVVLASSHDGPAASSPGVIVHHFTVVANKLQGGHPACTRVLFSLREAPLSFSPGQKCGH